MRKRYIVLIVQMKKLEKPEIIKTGIRTPGSKTGTNRMLLLP
jgi:5-enolpyruvylshikimate-3-phosphate synthase